MPTYEYRCSNSHEFERFYRTISGAPSTAACPECGADAVRMMSAGAGLLFKGSGFYLTDYGKNAHRGTEAKKEEGKKADEPKTEAKAGTKSETKSESKSESKSEAAVKGGTAAPGTESPKPKGESSRKPKSE